MKFYENKQQMLHIPEFHCLITFGGTNYVIRMSGENSFGKAILASLKMIFFLRKQYKPIKNETSIGSVAYAPLSTRTDKVHYDDVVPHARR